MNKMLKEFFKKTFMILLLLFVTISFSGFNSINSWVSADKNGYVCEWISVKLDRVAIEAAGSNIVQTVTKIDAVADQYVDTLKYSHTNPEDILKTPSSFKDNVYTFGIVFRNEEVYTNYYKDTEFEPNDYTEKHFFYSKVISTRHTVFSKHKDLYQSLLEKLPGETQVSFSYQSQFKRSHSDADNVKKVDDVYVHTWNIDAMNIDEPITIYFNILNSGVCILLAVGVSLLVCGVVFIVGLIKHKFAQKHEKTLKNIKN